MKSYFNLMLVCFLSVIACRTKPIKGDGQIVTQMRKVAKAEHLIFKGNFDIVLQPGNTVSVAIETDKNVQPFIIVTENDESLVFHTKVKTVLNTDHGIRIIITTPLLKSVYLGATGSITGNGKFTGADELKLDIAGNGDIVLDINTPKIVADIAGAGNIILSGETAVAEFTIAGTGEFNTLNLKAETARVKIAGNGNVKIFAASLLDVDIVGNGNVYYKGNPSLQQKIIGVGAVKQSDDQSE